MSRGETYEEFVGKFRPRRTTDDCMTPPLVYDAVASWVASEYGLDPSTFVRPFWPGGDYEAHEYPEGCAVVDNPPFSILARIRRFYQSRGVPYFLFAPTLTLMGDGSDCSVAVGATVTYGNGAKVNTSFCTSMERGVRMRTAPSLRAAVERADEQTRAEGRVELPRYEYPDEAVTSAIAARWCRYGVEWSVAESECARVSALDMQRVRGVGAYGGLLLLSERAAAERAAAERAAAERAAATRWQLSPRERRMVAAMGAGPERGGGE